MSDPDTIEAPLLARLAELGISVQIHRHPAHHRPCGLEQFLAASVHGLEMGHGLNRPM